jgi:uncharacterized protein YidB (DUF937 family)
MSGFFGQMLGSFAGGQSTAISGILQQVLAADGGGVSSLISRFEAAGLGDHVQSWVSNGENRPISADQVGDAFSADEIEGWANQAGTTPDKMREVLAAALPHAVDHVTPGGQVTEPDAMPDLSSLISRFLGGTPR